MNGDNTVDLKLKKTFSVGESTPALGKLQVILEDPDGRKENGAINEASLEIPAEEIHMSDSVVLRKGIPVTPFHLRSSLASTAYSMGR